MLDKSILKKEVTRLKGHQKTKKGVEQQITLVTAALVLGAIADAIIDPPTDEGKE